MSNDEDEKYEKLGYGKPPKNGRFKPGKSGNPRGRPKGRVALRKQLQDELDKAVHVTSGGRRVRRKKIDLMLEMMVNRSIKGHIASAREVIRMLGEPATEAELAKIEADARSAQLRTMNDYIASLDQKEFESLVLSLCLRSANMDTSNGFSEGDAPRYFSQEMINQARSVYAYLKEKYG